MAEKIDRTKLIAGGLLLLALRFIPKEQMSEQGYGDLVLLLEG